jgi:hypothetical protein
VSRKTQSSGVSGETLAFRSLPFTRKVMSGMFAPSSIHVRQHMVKETGQNENESAGDSGSVPASVASSRNPA